MQRTILYVPFNASSRGQWSLRRNADLVGQFATRDEAMRHALALTAAIRHQAGHAVEIKVEDEAGAWHLAPAGTDDEDA
ncbi:MULTISPECIES: hypothetical protein [Luteibacter]|uniref:DUF2188 domain-containing protein n=1 Tax=Luteibacter flocculans TaxID=2780091 RepID=A0ABY4SXJ8_9GAMM|nr:MULTISPECIES: hypothetical protein [Luteibacter]URL56961.1 hypothetical protein IM816_09790 [Luteibacter flocculans]SFW26922.1 hypothetical protein SAMN02800691_0661 [Luteibacter sp. UNCMF366Tsu5.1]